MMTKKQRLQYVRDQLATFDRLERQAVDRAQWIALKLSCSIEEAVDLIAASERA